MLILKLTLGAILGTSILSREQNPIVKVLLEKVEQFDFAGFMPVYPYLQVPH